MRQSLLVWMIIQMMVCVLLTVQKADKSREGLSTFFLTFGYERSYLLRTTLYRGV